MNIHVKLFGLLAETVGSNELLITDVSDTDSVRKKLLLDFPTLQKKSFVLALDKKLVNSNTSLRADSELALLPPFAGG